MRLVAAERCERRCARRERCGQTRKEYHEHTVPSTICNSYGCVVLFAGPLTLRFLEQDATWEFCCSPAPCRSCNCDQLLQGSRRLYPDEEARPPVSANRSVSTCDDARSDTLSKAAANPPLHPLAVSGVLVSPHADFSSLARPVDSRTPPPIFPISKSTEEPHELQITPSAGDSAERPV